MTQIIIAKLSSPAICSPSQFPRQTHSRFSRASRRLASQRLAGRRAPPTYVPRSAYSEPSPASTHQVRATLVYCCCTEPSTQTLTICIRIWSDPVTKCIHVLWLQTLLGGYTLHPCPLLGSPWLWPVNIEVMRLFDFLGIMISSPGLESLMEPCQREFCSCLISTFLKL